MEPFSGIAHDDLLKLVISVALLLVDGAIVRGTDGEGQPACRHRRDTGWRGARPFGSEWDFSDVWSMGCPRDTCSSHSSSTWARKPGFR